MDNSRTAHSSESNGEGSVLLVVMNVQSTRCQGLLKSIDADLRCATGLHQTTGSTALSTITRGTGLDDPGIYGTCN